MESPISVTPHPTISYHRHSTIRYFILHSIYSLMPMLCNFVQERNTFCSYFFRHQCSSQHQTVRLEFFFIKWNSILRKTTQKIKFTRSSSNRRDCFIIIQNSLCILNSTHSEDNIPLPYFQYSYF